MKGSCGQTRRTFRVFSLTPIQDHQLKLLAVMPRGGEAKHAGDVIMGDAFKLTFKLTWSHHRQDWGRGLG